MMNAAEFSGVTERRDRTADARADREKRQRFDVVDLFEELLGRRAELGHRPVLFVSSERDLECTLIGMFESFASEDASGEAVPDVPSVEQLRRRLG
jgi:hypothetical protein